MIKGKLMIPVLLGALIASNSHSGFVSNTAHSRANCYGFNESITWNWTAYHWWRVKSLHLNKNGTSHLIDTLMAYTWRSAAFHMKEWEGPNRDNWRVQGYHFYMDNYGREVYDVYTDAKDCAIYDGWWDREKTVSKGVEL